MGYAATGDRPSKPPVWLQNPFEAPKRDLGRLEIISVDSRVRQLIDMTPVRRHQPIPQLPAFFGQSDVDRSAVVPRTLRCEIALLDHRLDVVGNAG